MFIYNWYQQSLKKESVVLFLTIKKEETHLTRELAVQQWLRHQQEYHAYATL